MKVFITRKIPEIALNLIKSKVKYMDLWDFSRPPTYEELISRSRNIDGLLCMLTDKIDSQFINECKNLKVISNFAVGIDNIDLSAAKKAHIIVGNTPDVLTDATADLAISLLFSVARNILKSYQESKDGQWITWEPLRYLGQDLFGKTLGVFGLGRIGAAVAERLVNGWKMKLLYCSREVKPLYENTLGAKRVHFQELLNKSDIVTLHCDLNPSTINLFNLNTFQMMKKNSILINTARGRILSHDDLAEALKKEYIWGAGLDVTHPEPLPLTHPLWSQQRVVITPHVGSATYATREKMALIAAQNLLNGLMSRSPED